MESYTPYLDHPVFETISAIAERRGLACYVIGGYVRDRLLGRESRDIDIVVSGGAGDAGETGIGIEVAQEVARSDGRSSAVTVFRNFGTAMIRYGDSEVEFVGARKESYDRASRKPIVEIGTLEDDQNRRDFTINALAISLNKDSYGELIDPFSGRRDLEQGIIRTPLDPAATYSDDPLRMMRAIRFSAQLGFDIEEESYSAISANRERIRIVSAERISTELNKILEAPVPSKGFHPLFHTGLLEIIFPEMHALHGVEVVNNIGHKDNFFHTLKVLDNVAAKSDNLWLRWAAVLHDIAKPPTKRYERGKGWTFHGHEDKGARMVPGIFRRLRLPANEKMKYVQKLVRLHLRPIALVESTVTESAIRRLLFEAGDDIDDLMQLCEADITSKNRDKVRQYLRNFAHVRDKLVEVEENDKLRNWQPPVDGQHIMDTFGIGPGREVGVIKTAIREAILEGDIGSNYEEAYALMLKIGKKMGLKMANGKQ